MLFIATEKHPEVDGFTDFVVRHGDSYNGYTATDRTTYHFQLKPDRLPEALDRFAQFFFAPRFDPDYLEREKESVQSEYQLQSKQDAWRGDSVRKQLLNPAHPQSRFNIGNRETLRDAGVEAVRSFFEANYSADTITVAVLGPQDLDELQTLATERFGALVDRELGPRPRNPALYSPATLPASYGWRTVKSARNLRLTFPIPPLKRHYRTKPAGHLATLIGHEGPGSLHDVLSSRGWIETLSAGARSVDEHNDAHRAHRAYVGRPLLHGVAHGEATRLRRASVCAADRAASRTRLRRAGLKGRTGRDRSADASLPRRPEIVVRRARRRRVRRAQAGLHRCAHGCRSVQLPAHVAPRGGS